MQEKSSTTPATSRSPSLSILYVAPDSGTSLQRRHALEQLGHQVRQIDEGIPRGWRYQIYRIGFHLRQPPDLFGTNRAILAAINERRWDLVWVDKGLSIRPETLKTIKDKCPGTKLLVYSPDDCRLLHHDSIRYRRSIPEYDLHVTTKSYNVEELRTWGARDVLFIDNAYCPEIHRPMDLNEDERSRFTCDVGFVGFHESDRAEKMLRLAQKGIKVVIRGPAWNRLRDRHPNLVVHNEFLDDADYPKAINATKINLGFLRKQARDLQTTRSMEIPACGGFLLAERTPEHLRLFEEGREAEFFEGFEELLRKCRYYLDHPDERERIAAAGLERCRRDGYSNSGRLARVIEYLTLGRSECDAALASNLQEPS